MKIRTSKITTNEEVDQITSKEYLFECLDNETVSAQHLCRELLHFISESDAEYIIKIFELNSDEEYDDI